MAKKTTNSTKKMIVSKTTAGETKVIDDVRRGKAMLKESAEEQFDN